MELKRFFTKDVINDSVVLTGTEHNHLKNVMRKQVGDEVIVVCGDEYDYICKVQNITKNSTQLAVVDKRLNTQNPKVKLTVFAGLIQKVNMDFEIQKLSELGVYDVYPFESKFCEVKISDNKQDKLQEISNQSAKQCRRSIPMQVHQPIKFKDMLTLLQGYDQIIFANETEKKVHLRELDKTKTTAIVVGPKTGFAEEEIAELSKIATSISLGNRILKSETATIMLSTLVLYFLGEY